MTDDLTVGLGRVESAELEFKRSAEDRDVLRKAICALANDLAGAGGGVLLIGVDKHGKHYPVDVSDDALLAVTNLRDDGRLLDRPSVVVSRAVYDGAAVIRVDVHATSSPPVRLDGVVWVRPGPISRRATPDDERVLSERRVSMSLPFDSRALPGTSLADLDEELLASTYLPAAVAADVLAENHRPRLQQFASLRLCDVAGVATSAGLIIGGFDPSAHLPGAYVQFVRYEGDSPDSAVLDEEELRGNLVATATTLDAIIRGHLHTRLTDDGGFREQARPDYPLVAVRELLFNALMHRNYESSRAPTRLLWFGDHLEFSNPGGPYGQVRTTNFARVTDYRNPSLAAAMKSLGYVNRFGRGIGRVEAALSTNGNPAAEFVIDEASWSVTLRAAR